MNTTHSLVGVIREKVEAYIEIQLFSSRFFTPCCPHYSSQWLPSSGARGSGALGPHPRALLALPWLPLREPLSPARMCKWECSPGLRSLCLWLLLKGPKWPRQEPKPGVRPIPQNHQRQRSQSKAGVMNKEGSKDQSQL